MYFVMYVYVRTYIYICVCVCVYSRLVDFTARDDFLGLDNKKYQCGFCSLWLRSYGCCNCRKRPPVHRASQVTLHYLEPAGTGTVSKRCNSQVPTRAVYDRAAA